MSSKKINYATLPKKRMGAGCLITDASGKVLLVNPNYKQTWEIPGGIVEENESPRSCCKREINEELGINLPVKKLLLVDYNGGTKEKTESLMFVFSCPPITVSITNSIVIQKSELLGYQFFQIDDLPENLTGSLRRRILRAYKLLKEGRIAYFENLSD